MSTPATDRTLPANAKAIAKAVRSVAGSGEAGLVEFRVAGVRGLVLHALPSGTATWYFYYDVVQGRTRRRRKHKIGRLDEIGLAEATAEADRLRSEVRGGIDPTGRRTEARSAMTFAELAEARLTKGEPLRETSLRDYRHVLACDVLPDIGQLPASEVTRDHVIALIDKVAARGSTRRADTARAVVSSIYGFGLDRGHVKENPARDLRNRHDYQPRDVVLSGDQVWRLWRAMESGEAAMSPTMVRIVKLALLTGQRRAEVAATRKDEIDLDPARPCLIIGRGRAKNANQHRVPLSPHAVAVVREALAVADASPFLFPGPTGAAMQPRSVSKAMERTRERLGLGDVTVHDLRRTAGSMLTRFGVPSEVRSRVLNHGGKRKKNVTESVYSWYDHDAEKRAALNLWADALDAMVVGESREIEDYATRLAKLRGVGTVRVG